MEYLSQLLSVIGGLGLVGTLIVAFLIFLVLPIWAIVDCAVEENKTSRIVWILLLFFTWSLGSMIYGVFGTNSRALRRFTLFSLIIFGAGLVISLSTLTGAFITGQRAMQIQQDVTIARQKATIQDLKLNAHSPSSFLPIWVVQSHGPLGSSPTLVKYGPDGFDRVSARPLSADLKYVVEDTDLHVLYGLTDHDFGTLSNEGRFQAFSPPSDIGSFSWGSGLAYDSNSKRIFIATRAGATSALYTFEPSKLKWSSIPVSRDFVPLALAAEPTGQRLFVLSENTGNRRDLLLIDIYNFNGAKIDTVPLATALSFDTSSAKPQLFFTGALLGIVAPSSKDLSSQESIYLVDVKSREVFLNTAK